MFRPTLHHCASMAQRYYTALAVERDPRASVRLQQIPQGGGPSWPALTPQGSGERARSSLCVESVSGEDGSVDRIVAVDSVDPNVAFLAALRLRFPEKYHGFVKTVPHCAAVDVWGPYVRHVVGEGHRPLLESAREVLRSVVFVSAEEVAEGGVTLRFHDTEIVHVSVSQPSRASLALYDAYVAALERVDPKLKEAWLQVILKLPTVRGLQGAPLLDTLQRLIRVVYGWTVDEEALAVGDLVGYRLLLKDSIGKVSELCRIDGSSTSAQQTARFSVLSEHFALFHIPLKEGGNQKSIDFRPMSGQPFSIAGIHFVFCDGYIRPATRSLEASESVSQQQASVLATLCAEQTEYIFTTTKRSVLSAASREVSAAPLRMFLNSLWLLRSKKVTHNIWLNKGMCQFTPFQSSSAEECFRGLFALLFGHRDFKEPVMRDNGNICVSPGSEWEETVPSWDDAVRRYFPEVTDLLHAQRHREMQSFLPESAPGCQLERCRDSLWDRGMRYVEVLEGDVVRLEERCPWEGGSRKVFAMEVIHSSQIHALFRCYEGTTGLSLCAPAVQDDSRNLPTMTLERVVGGLLGWDVMVEAHVISVLGHVGAMTEHKESRTQSSPSIASLTTLEDAISCYLSAIHPRKAPVNTLAALLSEFGISSKGERAAFLHAHFCVEACADGITATVTTLEPRPDSVLSVAACIQRLIDLLPPGYLTLRNSTVSQLYYAANEIPQSHEGIVVQQNTSQILDTADVQREANSSSLQEEDVVGIFSQLIRSMPPGTAHRRALSSLLSEYGYGTRAARTRFFNRYFGGQDILEVPSEGHPPPLFEVALKAAAERTPSPVGKGAIMNVLLAAGADNSKVTKFMKPVRGESLKTSHRPSALDEVQATKKAFEGSLNNVMPRSNFVSAMVSQGFELTHLRYPSNVYPTHVIISESVHDSIRQELSHGQIVCNKDLLALLKGHGLTTAWSHQVFFHEASWYLERMEQGKFCRVLDKPSQRTGTLYTAIPFCRLLEKPAQAVDWSVAVKGVSRRTKAEMVLHQGRFQSSTEYDAVNAACAACLQRHFPHL